MKSSIGFMLASILFVAGQAHAEQERDRPRDPGVKQRRHYQQQRINQDVRQQEKPVRREDRKDLHQDINNLSKEIYQEKHDGEVRQ
ncbi:MAG: hypothetical protein ACYCZQ_09635 [Burkholderiales bacterium]